MRSHRLSVIQEIAEPVGSLDAENRGGVGATRSFAAQVTLIDGPSYLGAIAQDKIARHKI